MSKQLTTFIMRVLLVAALVLTGSGVQAGQAASWESVDLRKHSCDIPSGLEANCGTLVETYAEGSTGGNAVDAYEMDTDDCRSTCGNGQATNDYTISISSAVAPAFVDHVALAVIAVRYPIDHPPKRPSSI